MRQVSAACDAIEGRQVGLQVRMYRMKVETEELQERCGCVCEIAASTKTTKAPLSAYLQAEEPGLLGASQAHWHAQSNDSCSEYAVGWQS